MLNQALQHHHSSLTSETDTHIISVPLQWRHCQRPGDRPVDLSLLVTRITPTGRDHRPPRGRVHHFLGYAAEVDVVGISRAGRRDGVLRAAVGVENFLVIRSRLAGGIFKNIVGGSIGRPALNMGNFPRIDDPLNAPPPVMAISQRPRGTGG